MGTSTIFDIIGSAVVAGLLLLTALRLNAQANETSLIYNGSVRLQQNMVVLVEWIEDDFRRIGYCKNYTLNPFPTQSVRIANATDIMFWTDEGNDGTLDSIRWYIGPTSEMSSTPNPRDRMIYRKVNNDPSPTGWNLGVSKFLLTYYDYAGDSLATPVAQPSSIYSMRIEVTCETPFTFQEQYRAVRGADTADFQVHWQQIRMAAKNLRNR